MPPPPSQTTKHPSWDGVSATLSNLSVAHISDIKRCRDSPIDHDLVLLGSCGPIFDPSNILLRPTRLYGASNGSMRKFVVPVDTPYCCTSTCS